MTWNRPSKASTRNWRRLPVELRSVSTAIPKTSSKGSHAYPYVPMVWAYDAARLAAAADHRTRPWRVRPYATWRLSLPYGSPRIGGAAYDPRSSTIYVS